MKLVFATHNKNKLKEVQSMLPADIELLTLDEIGWGGFAKPGDT